MNMFSRRSRPTTSHQVDELRKKTAVKILDTKKDLKDRLRHLKTFIDTTTDTVELKQFFDQNYSQIYFIFYESFICVEANIKQKLSKTVHQDLNDVLFVFLKILLLQPERLHQRWQVRSIGRIIQKLTHVGNTKTIKFYGTRLFLIWYQILNTNKSHVEELMFQKLIHGFDTFHSSSAVQLGSTSIDLLSAEAQKVFTDVGKSFCPYEINPIIPVQPSDQTQPGQGPPPTTPTVNQHNQANSSSLTSEMLERVLEYMQQDSMLVEWSGDNKQLNSQKCYEFLFDEFKRFYLSYMFPNAFTLTNSATRTFSTNSVNSNNTSVNMSTNSNQSLNVFAGVDLIVAINEHSLPVFERPILASIGNMTSNDERKLTQLYCKEEIIKWLISVLLMETVANEGVSPRMIGGSFSSSVTSGVGSSIPEGYSTNSSSTIGTLIASIDPNGIGNRFTEQDKMTTNQEDVFLNDYDPSAYDQISVSSTITTNISINTSTTSISTITATNAIHQLNTNKQLLQKVILASVTNVNLVHEILRNAFFLNFESCTTVQQVLTAYKKWFLKEAQMPAFMFEPTNVSTTNQSLSLNHFSDFDSPMSSSLITSDTENDDSFQPRSNGFLNASLTQITSTADSSPRIGYMRCLQIFFYHSSNLLLNRNNFQRDKIKNVCCYTLEIYKLFIRKIKMDSYTWTLLITILLKVSEFLFNSEYLVNNRHEPATSQLIKLMTETVLLAIVKASFNFPVSVDLWDQLLTLLSSVSSNPDVIDKWIEVIDDLIRQVFKTSYQIDINNMPAIETNKKGKLKKKMLYPQQHTTPVTPTTNFPSPANNSHIPLTSTASNISQALMVKNIQKPRSKTEIYSPTSFNNVSVNTVVNKQTSPRTDQPRSELGSQPMGISGVNTSMHQNSSSSGSPSPNVSGQSSNSEKTVSTSVPPQLTKQPSITKIQKTFRDDTYLHTLGTVTGAELEPAKSPSLADDFPVINNKNTGSITSFSSKGKIDQINLISPAHKQKSPTNTSLTTAFSNATDISSQLDATTDLSEHEEDSLSVDDSKTATLKANQQLDTITVSVGNSRINRFNSDKSIYYSSELLAETNNNSSALNEQESSSSSSNQVSFTMSPTIGTSTSLPPVLPPLPPSHLTTKLSPPPQPSSVPPPLPPLPPALASKYTFNALKTALYLECVEPINTNSNETTTSKPVTEGINCETSSLDSGSSCNSYKSKDTTTTTAFDYRSERNVKCGSICSESEVFVKEGSHVDSDLSGEIFTSPTTPADCSGGVGSSNDMIDQVTSLLQASNVNGANNNNGTNLLLSLNDSNSNSPDASGLLMKINGKEIGDERGGSFIEGRSGRLLSRSSTLTPGANFDSVMNVNDGQIHRQATICTSGYTVDSQSQTVSTELVFKDTAKLLIKRLFGSLGNINAIKDPQIHKRVVEFIYNKWDKLNKIKDTLKLTDLSEVLPSITYFAPWLFESIYQLPNNYQSGKLIAYKTLCKIVIRSASNGGMWHSVNQFDSISDEFMNLFYMTIHQGLNSEDKHVVNCIIQNCGPKFWHCMLPSSLLLLRDFIDACALIDSNGPKYEAASILGCLIAFPDYFGDMHVLGRLPKQSLGTASPEKLLKISSSPDKAVTPPPQASGNSELPIELCTKEDLKNLIVHNLVNFSDDQANTNSRCVIICTLTCFIYDEILNKRWHPRLNDAIQRIFRDLDSRESFNLILVKMSCDNLKFLSILATSIFQYEIQYAINIINLLNQCLIKLINTKPSSISEDYEKAIISNMFALLEWCMSMPLGKLKENDRGTLLRNNFKLITHICNTFKPVESPEAEHVHLAARFIIQHLLTQLNHFPFASTGPSKIVSSVNETSDLLLNTDELTPILFEQPNIQFFTVNNQFLISFVELPMKGNEAFFNVNPMLKTSSTICRFIVRDFCGKNCWDCCTLQSPNQSLPNSYMLDMSFESEDEDVSDEEEEEVIVSEKLSKGQEGEQGDEGDRSMDLNNNFDFTRLPFLGYDEIPKEIDILDNILKFISFSSPECRLEPDRPLNIFWDENNHLNTLLNADEVKQKLINQSKLEKQHIKAQHKIEMAQLRLKQKSFIQKAGQNSEEMDQPSEEDTSETTKINSYFHLCKSFVHQMGLLSWEKRQSFNLLRKTPQLLRELKSLDDQTCRETHKIALIYIAEGQEDKMSILSNEGGSPDYEYFLSRLAWNVDLETHEGFMGGLHHNLQLKTAPYYATSSCEVLFHVSTQMNNQNDPNKISKWRHLGNDSVQIIWSEHIKDYDRSILATEFADVIICVYPLRNELYRIKITKKQSVGYFGPLFDGAIVTKQALPTLIRATAINASRIVLANTKGYQDFFVHRAHAINNIIKTLTDRQTFEQFIGDIYSPAVVPVTSTTSSTSGIGSMSTGTGLPGPTVNLSTAVGQQATSNLVNITNNADSSYNF